MNCNQYRRAVLADPKGLDLGVRGSEIEHLRACAECTTFAARLSSFEGKLQRALHVELPVQNALPPHIASSADNEVVVPLRGNTRETGTAANAGSHHTHKLAPMSRRWLAIAASVLVGIGVVSALWLVDPGRTLAADVVTHMGGEPQAWVGTVAVPDADLKKILQDSHLHLRDGNTVVTYASSCLFRGFRVPHLVVQSADGPVTVMILVHESVAKARQFSEQGYAGVILPVAGHGSLAVLERGSAADLDGIEKIAATLVHAVWTN